MAKNGFKAMDSDMHVFEPADLWQRYIDRKYLDRAPKGRNEKGVWWRHHDSYEQVAR